jgi:hypothetical protein
MSIFSPGFFGMFAAVGGIVSMTTAFERGDRDEASRQGALAGPVVIEEALASPVRATRLAAITAVPVVEARAELLAALATAASTADRRTAIPAARAARSIARELAQTAADGALPDDLDPEDLATSRALFDSLAGNPNRFVEVRVLALDTVASLAHVIEPGGLGFDLRAALGDTDPAVRAVAVQLVPRPTPAAAHVPLAAVVVNEADSVLALAAANVLCGDEPEPAVVALGTQGLDRIKALVAGKPPRTTRDARRCLER